MLIDDFKQPSANPDRPEPGLGGRPILRHDEPSVISPAAPAVNGTAVLGQAPGTSAGLTQNAAPNTTATPEPPSNIAFSSQPAPQQATGFGSPPATSPGAGAATPPPKPPNWFKRHKKLSVGLAVGLVLILGGGGIAAALMLNKEPPPPVAVAPEPPPPPPEPPKPATLPSPLTGVQVAPEAAGRPVTAIMIENSPEARPQAGLIDAGVVFEAIAEGGVTRFLALYQESRPGYIGPIRSLRPYFIDWFAPFDAGLFHVGGSKDALDQIRSQGFRDLDQFFNAGAYARITERYAPHNVYTNFDKIDALMNSKGFTKSEFTPWPRKEDQPVAAAARNASAIDFDISGHFYNPHYAYDEASNSYLRSQAGKPHVDDKSGKTISAKVVIAMLAPGKPVQASDGFRYEYTTTGSGKAYIFQDGALTEATWNKADRKTQLTFTDANGAPVKLNAGTTWISMVNNPAAITHK